MDTSRRVVVVLSTADFDATVWTNKQHVASQLACEFDVLFIESIGLRRPTLSRADVARMLRRLRRGGPRPEARPVPNGLEILRPNVIPLHDVVFVRSINQFLLRRQVRRVLQGRRATLWSFSPLTYGIEKYFDHLIYHSVDLLHESDRMPRGLVGSERNLVRLADSCIASSVVIRDHLMEFGTNTRVLLWENVADVDVFEAAIQPRTPSVAFAGNMTDLKVDFTVLLAVARMGVHLHLAGPLGIDGSAAPQLWPQLLAEPTVQYHGNLGPKDLSDLLVSCSVGLVPYLVNSHTAGIFPMKLYEYLAAGLGVVSTALPSIAHLESPDIRIAKTSTYPEDVAALLSIPDATAIDRRRATARSNSWSIRGREIRGLVNSLARTSP